MRNFSIAVLPGDGIGAEVIDATLPLLEQVSRGAPFGWYHFQAWHSSVESARRLLLGCAAMSSRIIATSSWLTSRPR